MVPTFPNLNPEIKCAWRWNRDPNQVTRFTLPCIGPDRQIEDEKPFALLTFTNAMPPFELWVPHNVSTITSWKLYDLQGNEVVDLEDDIPLLRVVQFATRDYVVYDGDALSVVLAPGFYESRLVISGHTYYSETVQTVCGALSTTNDFPNGDMTDGFTNFELGNFSGKIVDVETVAGDPSYGSPVSGDKVINTEDDLLYTYNGTSWVSSTPADGTWFGLDLDTWFQFNGGAFNGMSSPITSFNTGGLEDGGAICWDGTVNAPLTYFPIPGSPIAYFFRVNVFHGHPVTGSLTVAVDGNPIVVYDDTNIGQTIETNISLQADSIITFTPAGGFVGCLMLLSGQAYGDGSDCYHKLEWWSCGDVGTQYYQDGFRNRMLIPASQYIQTPSPKINIDTEEDRDGRKVETFKRKENTYSLYLDLIPWYLLDALTEIPMHTSVELTLAGNSAADQLSEFVVDYDWKEDCRAETSLLFQVDDATVASSCCDTFESPCLSPCADVYGTTDTDPGDLVIGRYYVVTGQNKYTQYLGFDDGPVDANGFGAKTVCPSAIVHGLGGYPDSYFDPFTLNWIPLADLSFNYNDPACDSGLTVFGTINPRYSGILQFSDGGPYVDLEVDGTSSEWASGIVVDRPGDSGYLRIEIRIGTCVIGQSLPLCFSCFCPEQTVVDQVADVNDQATVEAAAHAVGWKVFINADTGGSGSWDTHLGEVATLATSPSTWTFSDPLEFVKDTGGMRSYRICEDGIESFLPIPAVTDNGDGSFDIQVTIENCDEELPVCMSGVVQYNQNFGAPTGWQTIAESSGSVAEFQSGVTVNPGAGGVEQFRILWTTGDCALGYSSSDEL